MEILFRPAPPGRPTVVFFHGNAQSVASAWPLLSPLPETEFGIAAVEYVGYGTHASGHRPTEQKILAASEDALAVIRRQREVGSIILAGYSLGTVFASAMASRGHGERLVLAAPLTNAGDVVRRAAPYLPARLILGPMTLDNMALAPNISIPTLILHSAADEVFPATMARTLAAELPRAHLVQLSDAGHEEIGGWLAPAIRAASTPPDSWPRSEADLARC